MSKYSTSEVLTGDTWIDGKPIYRKTVSVELTSYSDDSSRRTFHYNHGISIDTPISQKGSWKIITGTYYAGTSYDVNNVSPTSAMGNNYGVSVANTGIDVAMWTSWGVTKLKLNVVLEYTKTTD